MTIQRAIMVLKDHNDASKSNGQRKCSYSAQEVEAAIDVAIHCLWKLDKMSEIFYFGRGDIG